jgi:hygromycin-B 4-O-kinase
MIKTVKPEVDKAAVARILEDYTGFPPREITLMSTGQISSTFQCLVRDETLLVQFNQANMSSGVTKERFFRDRLQSVGVPLREVIQDGTYQGLKYTIAKKSRGNGLTSLPPAEFVSVLPAVYDILLAISSVDMTGTQGYGGFNESGFGPDETWQMYLSKIRDEEPGQFFGNWHEMFDTTFLEKDRFEAYYSQMMRHINFIPVPRLLVHGAFGYDNVLIENGKVTAVLDWQDAKFGDPLFDIAYLDFWLSSFNLLESYKTYCAEHGIHYSDYRDRVLASKYYNALSAMLFFAKINNRDAYNSTIAIADNLQHGML